MLNPLRALDASIPAPTPHVIRPGRESIAASAIANKAVSEMLSGGESLLANYEGGLSRRNETQQISISLHSYESVNTYEDYILSYAYHYLQTKKDYREELRVVYQHYIILDDSATLVELFEAEPALYQLLIEAVTPLHHAFGDTAILHMHIQSSDEDSILKVAVQLPATFEGDPDCALQAFDDAWWVHQCHRSGGVLVFDYETPHAI